MDDKFPVRMALLAASLSFAGASSAGELERASSLAQIASYWPWIAVAAIFALLGVVSFASRRRIHAVVGS
jgi:hypothetical protein